MKRYLEHNKIAIVFIILQIIGYLTFLVLDVKGQANSLSSVIKFSMIILCFCFAYFFGKGEDKSIVFCMRTAMFLTVISDLFLLILNYYIFGVCTFILVQQLYGGRLLLSEHKNRIGLMRRFLLQLLTAVVVGFLLWFCGVFIDALVMISIFYFVCILSNTLTAVRAATGSTENKSNLIFAIGMVLFLLCDINVGLYNMSGFVALPATLYHQINALSGILMWTFYAPSQVLITLSSIWNCQYYQKNEKSLCKNM